MFQFSPSMLLKLAVAVLPNLSKGTAIGVAAANAPKIGAHLGRTARPSIPQMPQDVKAALSAAWNNRPQYK